MKKNNFNSLNETNFAFNGTQNSETSAFAFFSSFTAAEASFPTNENFSKNKNFEFFVLLPFTPKNFIEEFRDFVERFFFNAASLKITFYFDFQKQIDFTKLIGTFNSFVENRVQISFTFTPMPKTGSFDEPVASDFPFRFTNGEYFAIRQTAS